MNKTRMILSFLFLTQGLSPLFGTSDEETAWKNEISKQKTTRNALLGSGIAGAAVGIGFMVSGSNKVDDAKNTPGCEEDGAFNIICYDNQSYQQAKKELDDGKQQIYIGLGVGAVGAVLMLLSLGSSSKIDNLEREGRKKGFRLSLESNRHGDVQLLARRQF